MIISTLCANGLVTSGTFQIGASEEEKPSTNVCVAIYTVGGRHQKRSERKEIDVSDRSIRGYSFLLLRAREELRVSMAGEGRWQGPAGAGGRNSRLRTWQNKILLCATICALRLSTFLLFGNNLSI